jgi:hypothetical protein
MDAKLTAPRPRPTRWAASVVLLGLLTAAGVKAASVAYSYDFVGRVTTAVYDNALCIVYAYDANGNRSSQTNTSGGTPVSPVWGSGTWGCFFWTP